MCVTDAAPIDVSPSLLMTIRFIGCVLSGVCSGSRSPSGSSAMFSKSKGEVPAEAAA